MVWGGERPRVLGGPAVPLARTRDRPGSPAPCGEVLDARPGGRSAGVRYQNTDGADRGWIDLLQASQNADGRIEAFARGSDKALWHIWQTAPNNGWSRWGSLGGWIDLLFVAQDAT